MSGDLRAAVEGLREAAIGAVLDQSTVELSTGFYIDREDTLDELREALDPLVEAIPEGAVLVTEETLAGALEAHWPREMAPHPGARACAPDILRHLREGR